LRLDRAFIGIDDLEGVGHLEDDPARGRDADVVHRHFVTPDGIDRIRQ